MNENKEVIQDAGIRFFGRVTASISHEIKNVLAIINENAGLLEDLLLMYEKGGNLDTDRIKNLAGRVRDQVKRGDGIIKNMNQFAHSVDHLIEQVDLNELLSLMVRLAQRPASMSGANIESKAQSSQIVIWTNTFLLENLIWACLDLALNSELCPSEIILAPEILEEGARIRFTGVPGKTSLKFDEFKDEVSEHFLKGLQGDISFDRESGDIIIDLPRSISRG